MPVNSGERGVRCRAVRGDRMNWPMDIAADGTFGARRSGAVVQGPEGSECKCVWLCEIVEASDWSAV